MELQMIRENLRYRLQSDLRYYQQHMPKEQAVAWSAYLAALLEWRVLDLPSHDVLAAMLPDIENDPTISIMLGREEGG
ncbi:MAG: hypothetical protein WAZ19_08175 [Anaerolineae bacterium]